MTWRNCFVPGWEYSSTDHSGCFGVVAHGSTAKDFCNESAAVDFFSLASIFFHNNNNNNKVVVVIVDLTMSTIPALSFDLEAYIGRYPAHSETRLQRLLFIHRNCEDKQCSEQAKALAAEQIRASGNIPRYKELLLAEDPDPSWVAQVQQDSAALLESIEGRLLAAQAHLNKEAIRMGYLALCDFHRPRGDLRSAMRVALRSKDYCTNRNQTAHVCLLIMELAMEMREYQETGLTTPNILMSSIQNSPQFRSLAFYLHRQLLTSPRLRCQG